MQNNLSCGCMSDTITDEQINALLLPAADDPELKAGIASIGETRAKIAMQAIKKIPIGSLVIQGKTDELLSQIDNIIKNTIAQSGIEVCTFGVKQQIKKNWPILAGIAAAYSAGIFYLGRFTKKGR